MTSPAADENDITVLNFDAAMSHFGSMFPDISRSYIETVLRQHNGDVSSTIDDLLRFQQSSNGVASGSSFETSIKEPIDFDQCDGKKTENRKVVDVSEEAPSVSHQIQRTKPPENTVDDEKIALLMQNKEFLRYLRTEPTLMNEIYGSGHRRRHHDVHYPIVLTSSPIYVSRNSRKFEQIEYGQPVRSESPPPLLPDGPITGVSTKRSVPNGPLIDYVDPSSSKWTKKLKSRLPFSSTRRENSFAHKPMTETDQPDEEEGEHNQIDPAYLDDHQFVSKLQNLSRNSKSLLHSLAKKFSLSNGNARLSSKPISYPEPPNDELAYGSQHQNPI